MFPTNRTQPKPQENHKSFTDYASKTTNKNKITIKNIPINNRSTTSQPKRPNRNILKKKNHISTKLITQKTSYKPIFQ